MSVSTRAVRRILSLFTASALLAGLMVGTPSAVRAGAAEPSTQYVAIAGVTYVGAYAADCNSTTFKADSIADNEEVDSAVAAAAGGMVHFCAGDYFFTSAVNPGESELVGAGAASTSISGSEITRIFVTLGSVMLDGLTLRDGRSTGFGGGAILAYGEVTINDAIFTDNFSDSGGGAIAAQGAVTVTDSVFTNNSTTDRGGAIGSYGYVTVHSSRFTNNSSIADENCVGGGGAIAALDDVYVDEGSTFTGNTAILGESTNVLLCEDEEVYGGRGGAILTGEFALIYDSTFASNSSTLGGGAIYALALADVITKDLNGVIQESTFTRNTTTNDGDYFAFGGNAIYQGNYDLYITDSSFSSNTGTGSAVMLDGRDVGGTAVVSGSAFSRNTGIYGGAIAAVYVSVTNSVFDQNRAEWAGGAITAINVEIDRSRFTGNRSLRGGAVFYCGESVISNSVFSRNVAERAGVEGLGPDELTGLGGAVAGYGGMLTLIANQFTGNQASVAGGAVWLEGDAAESLVEMSKNRFTNNRAGRAGGAVGYNTLMVAGSVPSRGELRIAQRQNRFSGNRGGRTPLIGGIGVPFVV